MEVVETIERTYFDLDLLEESLEEVLQLFTDMLQVLVLLTLFFLTFTICKVTEPFTFTQTIS